LCARAGRLAQSRQPVRRSLERGRGLAEPELHALAGGDVRLLADARIHQCGAGVAGLLVECAKGRSLLTELLFGTDEEERSSANGDQGKNATRQPQRA
jgi:hypothetical protein